LLRSRSALGKNSETKSVAAEVDVNALDPPHRAEFEQFLKRIIPSGSPSKDPSK